MKVDSIFELFLRATRDYFSHGYFYYYFVSTKKNLDEKRLRKAEIKLYKTYQVTFCRTRRHRRKKKGLANCVVLRYKQKFLILATEGEHENLERHHFSDIRTTPLRFAGHEMFIWRTRTGGLPDASVRMIKSRLKAIRGILQRIELHNESKVRAFYQRISPYPFDGINEQKFKLLKNTNRRRGKAGLTKIGWQEVKPMWMYEK